MVIAEVEVAPTRVEVEQIPIVELEERIVETVSQQMDQELGLTVPDPEQVLQHREVQEIIVDHLVTTAGLEAVLPEKAEVILRDPEAEAHLVILEVVDPPEAVDTPEAVEAVDLIPVEAGREVVGLVAEDLVVLPEAEEEDKNSPQKLPLLRKHFLI